MDISASPLSSLVCAHNWNLNFLLWKPSQVRVCSTSWRTTTIILTQWSRYIICSDFVFRWILVVWIKLIQFWPGAASGLWALPFCQLSPFGESDIYTSLVGEELFPSNQNSSPYLFKIEIVPDPFLCYSTDLHILTSNQKMSSFTTGVLKMLNSQFYDNEVHWFNKFF